MVFDSTKNVCNQKTYCNMHLISLDGKNIVTLKNLNYE